MEKVKIANTKNIPVKIVIPGLGKISLGPAQHPSGIKEYKFPEENKHIADRLRKALDGYSMVRDVTGKDNREIYKERQQAKKQAQQKAKETKNVQDYDDTDEEIKRKGRYENIEDEVSPAIDVEDLTPAEFELFQDDVIDVYTGHINFDEISFRKITKEQAQALLDWFEFPYDIEEDTRQEMVHYLQDIKKQHTEGKKSQKNVKEDEE